MNPSRGSPRGPERDDDDRGDERAAAGGEDREEASADPTEAELSPGRQRDEADGDAVDELEIAEHPLGDEVRDARPARKPQTR